MLIHLCNGGFGHIDAAVGAVINKHIAAEFVVPNGIVHAHYAADIGDPVVHIYIVIVAHKADILAFVVHFKNAGAASPALADHAGDHIGGNDQLVIFIVPKMLVVNADLHISAVVGSCRCTGDKLSVAETGNTVLKAILQVGSQLGSVQKDFVVGNLVGGGGERIAFCGNECALAGGAGVILGDLCGIVVQTVLTDAYCIVVANGDEGGLIFFGDLYICRGDAFGLVVIDKVIQQKGVGLIPGGDDNGVIILHSGSNISGAKLHLRAGLKIGNGRFHGLLNTGRIYVFASPSVAYHKGVQRTVKDDTGVGVATVQFFLDLRCCSGTVAGCKGSGRKLRAILQGSQICKQCLLIDLDFQFLCRECERVIVGLQSKYILTQLLIDRIHSLLGGKTGDVNTGNGGGIVIDLFRGGFRRRRGSGRRCSSRSGRHISLRLRLTAAGKAEDQCQNGKENTEISHKFAS